MGHQDFYLVLQQLLMALNPLIRDIIDLQTIAGLELGESSISIECRSGDGAGTGERTAQCRGGQGAGTGDRTALLEKNSKKRPCPVLEIDH